MSTERDDTKPVPTGDQPTSPIPRSGTGRTEDPTLVFDTFPAEGTRESGSADDTRPMALGEAGSGGDTRPMPLGARGPAGDTAPVGEAAPPARTSAFATAGAGGWPGPGPGSTPPPPAPSSGSASTHPADELATPAPAPSPVEREIRTTLRVGTVVWGLILAIIGAGVIAIAAGARFDLELALIGLLALAGLALVVGSVVTGARRKR